MRRTAAAAVWMLALAAGWGCSPKSHGCGEEATAIDADDESTLGVSAREMVAACRTTLDTDMKMADGSVSPMHAELTVDLAGAELVQVLPAQGLDIACGDDFLRVPASLTIATADGSFSSSGPAQITGTATATVEQPLMVYNHRDQPTFFTLGPFTGTLPFDVDGYDTAAVRVSYGCPSGTGAAVVELSVEEGDTVAAFQKPIGSWTLPTGAQP